MVGLILPVKMVFVGGHGGDASNERGATHVILLHSRIFLKGPLTHIFNYPITIAHGMSLGTNSFFPVQIISFEYLLSTCNQSKIVKIVNCS